MARVKPDDYGKSRPKVEWDDMEDEVSLVVIATVETGEDDRDDPPRPFVLLTFEETGDSVLFLSKTQIEYLIEGLDTDESDDWVGKQIPIERVKKQYGKKTFKKVWVAPPKDWAGYGVGKKRTRQPRGRPKKSTAKKTTKRKRTKKRT